MFLLQRNFSAGNTSETLNLQLSYQKEWHKLAFIFSCTYCHLFNASCLSVTSGLCCGDLPVFWYGKILPPSGTEILELWGATRKQCWTVCFKWVLMEGQMKLKEIVSMPRFGYLSPLPFPWLYLSINFSKITFKGMYAFNYFWKCKNSLLLLHKYPPVLVWPQWLVLIGYPIIHVGKNSFWEPYHPVWH